MTMVVGMFNSLVDAQRAVTDVVASGFARAAISVIVRQASPAHACADDGRRYPSPPDADACWRVLAGGPLALSLRSAAANESWTSVAQAFVAAGLQQAAARFFAESIARGAVVVTVHCEDSRVRDARDILDLHAGTNSDDAYAMPLGEDAFPHRPLSLWQSSGL
jgi:hypothetical protein